MSTEGMNFKPSSAGPVSEGAAGEDPAAGTEATRPGTEMVRANASRQGVLSRSWPTLHGGMGLHDHCHLSRVAAHATYDGPCLQLIGKLENGDARRCPSL